MSGPKKSGRSLARLHKVALEIDQNGALTPAQIHARARAIKRKHGRLDLLCVDYLGLVRPPHSKTASTRNDEVSLVSAALKAMAKELGCPIMALAQLSRKVEERSDKRPQMSDLRDSGSIEQDADVILMMYRDEYYNKERQDNKGMAEAIVAKHRNGEPGTVYLAFEGKFCRFRETDQNACRQASAQKASATRRTRGFDE